MKKGLKLVSNAYFGSAMMLVIVVLQLSKYQRYYYSVSTNILEPTLSSTQQCTVRVRAAAGGPPNFMNHSPLVPFRVRLKELLAP